MQRLGIILWTSALVACSGSDDGSGDVAGTDVGDSDTGTPVVDTDDTDVPPVENEASCTNGTNPLVIECTATMDQAGPATLTLSAAGKPTRTFESPDSVVDHQIFGWGLKADTTYDWELAGQSGTVTTGSLPAGLDDLNIQRTGTLFGIDAVLIYVNCGWFVMIDGDGDVVWGIPTSTYDTFSDAMRWSQADRSVIAVRDSTMSFDSSLVVENHVSGTEVLRLEPSDFQLKLTHDVDRWGPYTYLLGEDNRIGGFEVWEGTNYLGTWLLTDDFAGVSNLNTAHVNGLSVADDGEVIVSVYGFDSIVSVDGDPSSPTFLQKLWHANGEPGGPDDLPNPDYVPPTGTLFLKQHNASRHGDFLWVFDNQSDGNARALRMAMDPTNGLVTEDASWSTNQRCMNQGGALPIDGGALVTCANSGDIYAFREGMATADWTLNATCGTGGFGTAFELSTRAYPVLIE